MRTKRELKNGECAMAKSSPPPDRVFCCFGVRGLVSLVSSGEFCRVFSVFRSFRNSDAGWMLAALKKNFAPEADGCV